MKNKKIYLDHNATTPVDPRVLNAMLPYFNEIYGNASSIDHDFGFEAKKAVDNAREIISKSINAFPDEIIFTSGATESNNLALFGVVERYKNKGSHIITNITEHKAVLDCCRRLEKNGARITYLPVDEYGRTNIETLKKSIKPETILISIMAANNEVGTISSLQEIGNIAEDHGILFHSDGAQAFGQISIDVKKMKIDILSLSAHKLYGPKGIGVLYRRKSNPRVFLEPIIYGGGHEFGLRSGTLNVPSIVGFGEAVTIALKEMKTAIIKYKKWTSYIFNELARNLEGIELNGHPENRLANNLSIFIPGIESKALIILLKDIAISTGSACTSSSVEPSHVITALGKGDTRAHSTIRIGVGRFNTDEEIEVATDRIITSVKKLQTIS